MSNFMDNYERANDTIKRFWTEYPVGRILPTIVDIDLVAGWVLFKADVYREYQDLEPAATGHAYGNVAFYPANMKRWLVEDTETSAVARAIKCLTPSTERPSLENMQEVAVIDAMPLDAVPDPWAIKPELPTGISSLDETVAVVAGNLASGVTDTTPKCLHGSRVFRKGKADEWGAYFCPQPKGTAQCEPIWCELGSNGKWQIK